MTKSESTVRKWHVSQQESHQRRQPTPPPAEASGSLGAARYIGRVGALAFALGLGVAIANGSGVAHADGSGSRSDAGSASAASSSSTTGHSRRGGTQTAASAAATQPRRSNSSSAISSSVAAIAKSVTPVASTPAGQSVRSSTSAVDDSVTAGSVADQEFPSTGSAGTSSTAAPTAEVQSIPAVAAAKPAAISHQVTGLVSGLLTAAGIDQANVNPTGPMPIGAHLLALIEGIRREIVNRLFASSPVFAYNPTQNVQTFDGVVTGNLNASSPNGYALTYTINQQPKYGSVVVGTDGTFTYTPNPGVDVAGTLDTFTVTADDQPGNPWHLHGLAALFLAPNGGATTTNTIALVVKPTSSLGTEQQISMEQLAVQIIATPQMQAAMNTLRTQWLADAQAKFALAGGVDGNNLGQLNDAVTEWAISSAYQQINNDPTNPQVLTVLTPPHQWYGTSATGARYIYDNPDSIYRTIPVNVNSSYVIHGQYQNYPASVPIDGNFGVYSDLSASQPVGNLLAKDIVINPDGSFDITVDSSATAPGQTNHIQLAANAQQLFIRYTLSDWNTQVAPSLTVERVSGPPPAVPKTFDELVAATVAQTLAISNAIHPTGLSLVTVIPPGSPLPPLNPNAVLRQPNTVSAVFNFPGTLITQKQSLGYFNLTDNQAMVLTINPGNAGYFIVPVTNDWMVTGNFWDQQTSLNNQQAVKNADGTYTIVISKTDPGVANWVSTGGLNQGTLFIRFQALDPNNPTSPTISAQVVPIAQLNLPVITPEERAAQIALRQTGFNKRYAPFPQT